MVPLVVVVFVLANIGLTRRMILYCALKNGGFEKGRRKGWQWGKLQI